MLMAVSTTGAASEQPLAHGDLAATAGASGRRRRSTSPSDQPSSAA
jgi:hypothetical protein